MPASMSTPRPAPWLTIKNLNFKRGKKYILKNINLEFYPGKHYILAGPNGAGKSTLLDIISGLNNKFTGEVTLFNKNILTWRKKDLAKLLALAPQDYRLNFPFTVAEMVSFGRRPYLGRFGYLKENDYQVIEQAISEVDLSQHANSQITNLSGGEKQRAILARALSQESRILLLDEPTAGLDIYHALKIMSLASTKAKNGFLVLTVTHNLSLAASFGDEFIFLKNGEIISAGPAKNVLNSEVLAKVYNVEAKVEKNSFINGNVIFFR